MRVRVGLLVVDGVELEDGGEDPILLADLRSHLVRVRVRDRGRGRVRGRVRVRDRVRARRTRRRAARAAEAGWSCGPPGRGRYMGDLEEI